MESTSRQIALIEGALLRIERHLSAEGASARSRELRVQTARYARVVQGWSTGPPTSSQLAAMFECVAELYELVTETKLDAATVEPFAESSKPPPAIVAPTTERRAQERVPLEIEVTLASESHFFTGLTGDISTGGILVSTLRRLNVGLALTLTFVLPEGVVFAEGTVRWVHAPVDGHGQAVGVMFDDLPVDSRILIERFCATRPPLYYDVDDA